MYPLAEVPQDKESPQDREYRMQERAGILEYEGEMTRDAAEALAWKEVFCK